MKEKAIENQIKNWLEKQGYWWMKVHGDMFQKAGIPDIITCVHGRFVAIEVKRPNGGVVSALQKYNINKIKENEGIAFVARSLDDVKSVVERLNAL